MPEQQERIAGNRLPHIAPGTKRGGHFCAGGLEVVVKPHGAGLQCTHASQNSDGGAEIGFSGCLIDGAYSSFAHEPVQKVAGVGALQLKVHRVGPGLRHVDRPARPYTSMDYSGAMVPVQKRLISEPVHEEGSVGVAQNVVDGVLTLQLGHAVVQGEQVKVVVAEYDMSRVPKCPHKLENFDVIWSAVDEIADEPQLVCVRGDVGGVEQLSQCGAAAVDIADDVGGHVEMGGYGRSEGADRGAMSGLNRSNTNPCARFWNMAPAGVTLGWMRRPIDPHRQGVASGHQD